MPQGAYRCPSCWAEPGHLASCPKCRAFASVLSSRASRDPSWGTGMATPVTPVLRVVMPGVADANLPDARGDCDGGYMCGCPFHVAERVKRSKAIRHEPDQPWDVRPARQRAA